MFNVTLSFSEDKELSEVPLVVCWKFFRDVWAFFTTITNSSSRQVLLPAPSLVSHPCSSIVLTFTPSYNLFFAMSPSSALFSNDPSPAPASLLSFISYLPLFSAYRVTLFGDTLHLTIFIRSFNSPSHLLHHFSIYSYIHFHAWLTEFCYCFEIFLFFFFLFLSYSFVVSQIRN